MKLHHRGAHSRRRTSSRRTSSRASRVLAAAILWVFAPVLSSLAEGEAPLATGGILETAWYEADPTPDPAPVPVEMPLAQRVEALEAYIHELETEKAAAADAKAIKEDAPKEEKKEEKADQGPKECVPKKVEIIAKPTFTPTGRIFMDGVTYDDDDATADFFNTDRANEFGFRTFRIGGKGNVYENVLYTMEFEIRGGPQDITFKDIYMQATSLPVVGNFRAGHFKEPIGLEEFGSDLYGTFMEKNYATSTFAPSRNFGLMMYNRLDDADDATWFAGLFRSNSPDTPNNSDEWREDGNDWTFASRFAFLPYYDEPSNGRYLVHLGGSYSYRSSIDIWGNQNVPALVQNDMAEFSPRAWVGSQGPIGVGAEANSDAWNQFGGEFLVIWGSASLQAEYFQAIMNSGEDYSGASVFVTYFLTGECRAYKKETKTIDRVQLFEPAFWIDTAQGWGFGRGAWELAAGYSYADLEEGHDINAGRERAFVDGVNVGLNWYHNPWSRLQINWNHEITDFVDAGTPDSNANIFGIRWQIDWQ